MLTDIGEYIVGAYLQLILECDVIDYNVRPPGGGVHGLAEFDVIGFDFKNNTAYLCEVTTHIRGLSYINNKATVERITEKHNKQKWYADNYLSKNFQSRRFMFWSPVVPRGYITQELAKIPDLELVINGEYKKKIAELRMLASQTTHDARNPFFRMLQFLEHLRD